MAQDVRLKASFGVAVMLEKDGGQKCQMVKLGAQQAGTETESPFLRTPRTVLLDEPQTVPMDRMEFFTNCTLISDECLLLFTHRFRLISEDKVVQISLPFPRDINQVKTCTPFLSKSGDSSFLASCLMQSRRSKFITNFKRDHPERVHTIRDKDRFNAWVSKWTIDAENKAFELDKSMQSSIFVRGDEVEFSQKFNDDSIMV